MAKFDGTNWTVYNTSNSGLPNNYVCSLAIDGSGNKWIGTNGGLAKFDGTNWTVYNTSNSGLPDNSVHSITIDESGNKWIGTVMAVWQNLMAQIGLFIILQIPVCRIIHVHSIAIDGSGNKWIGTFGGGLAKFDGTNWTVYNTSNSGLPDNDVSSLAIDGSGNKWIGT